ncbi:MAG: LptF/LptG family permease [bacterium]|nr:LptF/LptG family permease [bacterium]
MLKLIDRYLISSFLLPLFYCLLAFFILFVAYDMSDQLKDFFTKQIPPKMIVRYYLYYIPIIFNLTAPFASLLAMLYCLGNMSRNNEIIAMRASGIALSRIVRPYLLIGLVMYGIMLILADTLVPRAHRLAAEILPRPTTVHATILAQNKSDLLSFYTAQGDRQWIVGHVDPTSNVCFNVVVIEYSHGRAQYKRQRLEAARAEFIPGRGWLFYDVDRLRYFPDGSQGAKVHVPRHYVSATRYQETPQDIVAAQHTQPSMMTLREILATLRHTRPDSDNYRKMRMEFHNRTATPAACIVFVLLAAPFGIFHTRAGMVKGVITSILLCLFYYFLGAWFINLGSQGYLAPLLAAWLPSIVFAGIGCYLLYRMR